MRHRTVRHRTVRHRTVAILAACVVLPLSVAACSGDPWVDSRREAGKIEPVGESTADRPAICYAPGEASAETLHAMAQTVCDRSGRQAVFIGTQKWQCRLTTPHRALFRCR